MTLLLVIAYFAVMVWFVRRARERAAEHVASGLSRSPLYWVTSLLTLGPGEWSERRRNKSTSTPPERTLFTLLALLCDEPSGLTLLLVVGRKRLSILSVRDKTACGAVKNSSFSIFCSLAR